MNHPKREEWAPYLFGETKLEVRRELNAHLKECADCRQEIENWQRSLARLDAWKLQPVPKPGLNFAPYLNWAAAAALLLLLGFGIGRLTAKADVDKVRAAIEPAMRRELSQEKTGPIQARKQATGRGRIYEPRNSKKESWCARPCCNFPRFIARYSFSGIMKT